MRILTLERPTSSSSGVASESLLREEASRVRDLCRKGVIREIYFREDRREAVVMLEARDAAEAKDTLSSLPLVRERVIDFEIIPLVEYSGFERLLSLPEQ